jgi:hypothetical protein
VFKKSKPVYFTPPRLDDNGFLALVKTVTLWVFVETLRKEQELVMGPFLNALAAKTPSLYTLRLIDIYDHFGYKEPHKSWLNNLPLYLPSPLPLLACKQNIVGDMCQSVGSIPDYRAMVYDVTQRRSELWTRASVASYWSPPEKMCPSQESQPLSGLREGECIPIGCKGEILD